jgi:hypothetical protein
LSPIQDSLTFLLETAYEVVQFVSAAADELLEGIECLALDLHLRRLTADRSVPDGVAVTRVHPRLRTWLNSKEKECRRR